jgi:hypothetical protein
VGLPGWTEHPSRLGEVETLRRTPQPPSHAPSFCAQAFPPGFIQTMSWVTGHPQRLPVTLFHCAEGKLRPTSPRSLSKFGRDGVWIHTSLDLA